MANAFLDAMEKMPSTPTVADLRGLTNMSASMAASATKAATFFASIGQTATIHYDKNNASATGSMADQTVEFNTPLVLASNGFADDHDVFLGWNDVQTDWEVDSISYVPGDTIVPQALAITLYGVWTDDVVTITFNKNDGTGTMASQRIPRHHVTALNANTFVAPTGFGFKNWATAANGSGTTYLNNGNIAPDVNTTLYAIWDENNFTITFNANGGTGTLAAQTIKGDESANLTRLDGAFTRTDYNFAGWATTSGGTVAYADNASYTMGLANVTLYAVWTIAQRTVTFNGSTPTGGATATQTITVLTSEALNANGFTKTGCTFVGWATSALNAAAGTLAYADNASYTMAHLAVNVTLYAIWSTIVTFNANSGTGTTAAQTVTVGKPTTLTASGYARVNCVFAGWATSQGNADAGTRAYTDADTITATGAITLYAIWTNSVTFNKGSGDSGSMSPVNRAVGSSAALPAFSTSTFVKAGKTFTGWNTAIGGGGTAVADEAVYVMTSGVVVLYAQWTA